MLTKKYIKYFSGTNRVNSWKSNGMSKESIEDITKSDSNFAPVFVDHHLLPDVKFKGHCLLINNISALKNVIHLYVEIYRCITFLRTEMLFINKQCPLNCTPFTPCV